MRKRALLGIMVLIIGFLLFVYVIPTIRIKNGLPAWDESQAWVINRCVTWRGPRGPIIDQVVAIPLSGGWLDSAGYIIDSDEEVTTDHWVTPNALLQSTTNRRVRKYQWFDIQSGIESDLFRLQYESIEFGKGTVPPYWIDLDNNRYIAHNLDSILINDETHSMPVFLREFLFEMHGFQDDWRILLSESGRYMILFYTDSDYLFVETDLSNHSIFPRDVWDSFAWSATDDILIGLNRDGTLHQLNPSLADVSEETVSTRLSQRLQAASSEIVAWSSEQDTLVYRTQSEALSLRDPRDLQAINMSTGERTYIGQTNYASTVDFVDESKIAYWEIIPVSQESWYEPAQRRFITTSTTTKQLVMYDIVSRQETVILDPDWIRLGNDCYFENDFAILKF